MPIISVSGHSRKVGKTSIAEGLIAALPEYGWTALKVSSHRHSGDSAEDYTVIEETSRDGASDTSRFLKAGALHAFWIQAERIEAAVPAVRAVIKDAPFVIIEGNSVLDFIAADFSILVLNSGVAEFKKSAGSIIPRADALVLIRESAKPGYFMGFQPLVGRKGVDTRRAQRGRRRHTGQYVKETEQAQRTRHARLRARSRNPMKYPGKPSEWETILESALLNTPSFKTGDPKIFPPALTELLRSRLGNL